MPERREKKLLKTRIFITYKDRGKGWNPPPPPLLKKIFIPETSRLFPIFLLRIPV